MEIGYPTDVKHVAHIGWDGGPSVNTPSWVNICLSSIYQALGDHNILSKQYHQFHFFFGLL